jgi:hypothetical protein
MNKPTINPHQQLLQQIDLMLRARYPLLYIVGVEEEPIEQVLQQLTQISQTPRQLLLWDIVTGWHGNYEGAPIDGSAWLGIGTNTNTKVLRGGSRLQKSNPEHCRSAYRYNNYLLLHNYYPFGIRVGCSGAART